MARKSENPIMRFIKYILGGLLAVGLVATIFQVYQSQDLRGRASNGNSGLPVNLLIYTDKARAQQLTTIHKKYIQPNDIFVIGVGGRSMNTVNETARILRAGFPENRIFATTSIKNLARVSSEASDDIEMVLLDYEQSNYPNWTWEFDIALSNIENAMNIVRENGKNAGIVPPGSALRNDLYKKYAWNFGEISSLADYQMIMMQGICRRDTGRFKNNMETLVSQYSGKTENLSVIIAIGDTPNAVSPQVAYKCSQIAYEAGIPNITLFDPEKLEEYLKLVRPQGVVTPAPTLPGSYSPSPSAKPNITQTIVTPKPSNAQVPILLNPRDGDTLAGEVFILTSIVDRSKLRSVEFYIDGARQAMLLADDFPYRHYFDSSRFVNGTHTAYVVAHYREGISAKSSIVTFTIKN